jgi:hypothetical protein
MSGWLRHFTLSAQARTGYSSQFVVWAVVAIVAAAIAIVFLLIAAFVWLADRYDPLIAGLILGGAFIALALIAVAAANITRRRNIARAERELAARRAAGAGLLDPNVLAVAVQIGQAIGWRRLLSLAAAGILAAGLAREWYGRSEAGTPDDTPPSDK